MRIEDLRVLLSKPWAELTDEEIDQIFEALNSNRNIVITWPRAHGKDTIAKAMNRWLEEK